VTPLTDNYDATISQASLKVNVPKLDLVTADLTTPVKEEVME
jgi:hypothetical protein